MHADNGQRRSNTKSGLCNLTGLGCKQGWVLACIGGTGEGPLLAAHVTEPLSTGRSSLLLVHQHSGVGRFASQLLVELGYLLHRDTLALHSKFQSMLSVCSKGLQLHKADVEAESLGGTHLLLTETQTRLRLALTWQLELQLYTMCIGRQHWHLRSCMSHYKRVQCNCICAAQCQSGLNAAAKDHDRHSPRSSRGSGPLCELRGSPQHAGHAGHSGWSAAQSPANGKAHAGPDAFPAIGNCRARRVPREISNAVTCPRQATSCQHC